MIKYLSLFLLFFLAVLPRYGAIDIVLLLSCILVMASLFKNGKLKNNKFWLINILSCSLIFIPTFVSFIYFGDYFGLVRLLKLLLLFMLVPLSLQIIGSKLFFSWFPFFLLLAVLILYVEYLDIGGGRALINSVHNKLFYARDVSFRAKGLFAGYSAAGVTCGFISLFSLFYTIKGRVNPFLGYGLFFLALLATFFTGRTGIAISLLGTLVILLRYIKALLSFNRAIYFLSVVFSFFLVSIFIYRELDWEVVNITIIRTFEIFYNYSETNNLSSESTTQLAKTISIPHDTFEIIFGNGLEPWSAYAISIGAHQTDSGLVQILFMYGVLSFFLYYFSVFHGFLIMYFRKCDYDRMYFFLAITLGIISEVKGHYIFSTLIFVLIFTPLIYLNEKDNRHENISEV
ncbi:hypothetical protein DU976_09785 [Vibrio navarrensis]|nr:hypothetical protein [Vibrio navarrensis]